MASGGSTGEPSLAWLGEIAGDVVPLARIWATVEIERALADLGIAAAHPPMAIDDALLGARVVVVPSTDGGLPIALAEPSTEGRLAATLARTGEGPAGRYLAAPASLATLRALAVSAGVELSRPAAGPFGLGVLVVERSMPGPHLILVGAAVPSRP